MLLANCQMSAPLEHKGHFPLSLENQFANSIYSGPTSGCIHEPETKSYARKNSHTASFTKNKMPNITWKSYARKRTASFINNVASQAASRNPLEKLYERKTKSILRNVSQSSDGQDTGQLPKGIESALRL